MRIKSIVIAVLALGAAQFTFALPPASDAGDALQPPVVQASNSAGYLSSTPVVAPEVTQSVAPKSSSINDDLLTKMNAMEQEVQTLQGRVDELQHELKRSTEENALVIAELRKKISETPAPVAPAVSKTAVSSVPAAKTSSAAVVAVPISAKAAPVAATTPEAQEKATYDAAYSLVSAKAYPDAIEAFTGYLTIYPDGKYVPQANYWLGELNASQQLYPTAIQYLEVVVKQYPKSTKAPDAMLKLGIINKRLGNDAKAQTWFARLMKEYPQSPSAQSAKEYLVN